MAKISAVLFDLYNTLVPFSFTDYPAVVTEMAAALHVSAPAFAQRWRATWVQHEAGTFATVEDHIQHVCAELGQPVAPDEVRAAATIHYRYQQQLLAPASETIALLTLLRQRGYQLGVISNCPMETPQLWPSSLLAPLFDVALFSVVVQVRKPDAAIFHLACQQLNRLPNECIMVGDAWSADVLGALHAGLAGVWLNPQAAPCPEPDVALGITTLTQLVDLLPAE